MTRLRAQAPAKVNLVLAIVGRRDDGYHQLRSVFLRLGLHDELEVELDPAAGRDSLAIDADPGSQEGEPETHVGEPIHAENLVLRATAQLRGAIGGPLPALRFRLRKRIPVAAGLAGGSSDAAAAIDLALAAWGVRLHPAERLAAALRLGADVPFFAAGHPASLVEGIGERLVGLPAVVPPAGILLITPAARLSTAAVFAEHDRGPAGSGAAAAGQVDEVVTLLREGLDGMTLAATTAVLRDANDLWPAASRLAPDLRQVRDAGTRILGRALLLSGSGPTLFAVYPSEAAAARAATELQGQRPPELRGATIISTSTQGRGGDS